MIIYLIFTFLQLMPSAANAYELSEKSAWCYDYANAQVCVQERAYMFVPVSQYEFTKRYNHCNSNYETLKREADTKKRNEEIEAKKTAEEWERKRREAQRQKKLEKEKKQQRVNDTFDMFD